MTLAAKATTTGTSAATSAATRACLGRMGGGDEQLVLGRVAHHRLALRVASRLIGGHARPNHVLGIDERVVEALVLDEVDAGVVGRVLGAHVAARAADDAGEAAVVLLGLLADEERLLGALGVLDVAHALLDAQIDLGYAREHLVREQLDRLGLRLALDEILGHVEERVARRLELLLRCWTLGRISAVCCRCSAGEIFFEVVQVVVVVVVSAGEESLGWRGGRRGRLACCRRGCCGRRQALGALLQAHLLFDELLHLGVLVALVGLLGEVAVHVAHDLVAATLLQQAHVDQTARFRLPRIVLYIFK